jgi:hypothetical protein
MMTPLINFARLFTAYLLVQLGQLQQGFVTGETGFRS